MSRVWSKLFIFVLIGLGSWPFASAQTTTVIQPKSNSPYSRIGLGDMQDQFFAAQTGLAGSGIALHDGSHLNMVNPASLANLNFTAFETGIYGRFSNLTGSDGQTSNFWSGNINYLALGFPLKNSLNQAIERRNPVFMWGMSFALQPYTLVGYNIELKDEAGEFGSYTNTLKGNGGTYKLSWNNGWRYKNFALGLSTAYLFGKITNSRRVELDNVALIAYATEFLDEISFNGLVWNAGLQYTLELDKDNSNSRLNNQRRVIFGAFAGTSTSFNTKVNQFYSRDNYSIRGDVDTVGVTGQFESQGRLPAEYGFGLTYEQINKFLITVDYRAGRWSQYENEARPETLVNNMRVSLGAQLIPDAASYNNYFERVRYRAGLFYGTDPREISGEQLAEYGLTFGFGFPVFTPRQQTSYINFGVEMGRFGINDGLRENFIQMTLGFTLNDNSWFFKRKFN